MSVYKDGKQGTWYASFRYTDWMGQRKQKMKRGFRTKKEAVKFEMEFIASVSGDMDMTFASFIEVYFQDKSGELKQNSVRNKRDMMNAHILPYFGEKKMNEVTPADIIAWQNEIRTKGYKPTYERMRSSFVLMQIAAKYMKLWISLLKILYILIQYFYRKVSFCRSHSHIFSISNLENYFVEQLFLLSLTDFFIVVCNLPVLSFPYIVPFHRIIKQLFIYFFQIFILVTDIQVYSVRIYIFCYKIPSVMSQ